MTPRQKLLHMLEKLPAGWFVAFVVKLGWAAIFGGLMLAAIVITKYVELPWLLRYDWLFVFAILIQLFLVATKLERPSEVITIFVFHLVGLGMELFKTSGGIQSWTYPEDAFFKLGNVPLYSGFMYAAVGSFIARAWRVLELEFRPYPKRIYTFLLAIAIYVNFFTHHYVYDTRWLLLLAFGVLYGRTWVYYTIHQKQRRMPFIAAGLLSAFFVWAAENIGTYTKTWLYPNQTTDWHLVSLHKLTA
ncbi:MAG: hypothetical protein QG629_134 [Patescibacteria group bacterium]|nr:DUF817 domain-containing protein [Candidatus Saccharibacteria bacterium]MDQ5963052.1 hypothetical protein [Patescibacteria group bacterium]